MPGPQLSTLFERNAEFVRSGAGARRHVPELPFLPWQHAYVITCIDPRTDPSAFFGVGLGDAIVARTVGGRVTSCTTPTAGAGCSPTTGSATGSSPVPASAKRR